MCKKLLIGMAAVMLLPRLASAQDDLRAEIADLRSKVAALESSRMAPAAGGDCEALTSMKKKASIKIGGGATVDTVFVSRDDTTSGSDEVDAVYFTTFDTNTGPNKGVYLDFEVRPSTNAALYIRLDLNDDSQQMEEVYFQWTNVMGHPWTVAFGKKAVAYGMDKYVGVTPSFHDGWAAWLTGLEENEGPANPHGTIGLNNFPTGPTRTFAIETSYTWKDLVTVTGTLFQNARGMHEDRPDDNLLFESYAVQATMMPLEGLNLQASFIKQHNDTRGDRHFYNGFNRIWVNNQVSNSWAEADQYAMSVGADYQFKSLPLNLWGEYQHGWNWGYDDSSDVDVLGMGMTYGINESMDVTLLGEWAGVDGSNANAYDDEDYYQVVLTGVYKTEYGIYFALEYAHQWFDGDTNGSGDDDREADMVGFRTGFEF